MPRLKVDLREAQSREALPDGTYSCKIFDISAPKTGEKSSYVSITYEVIEGEFEGRKIFENRPITGKGAGMFAEFYSKVTGEDISVNDLEELDVDTDDLIGEEIGVVTKQREYPEGSGDYVSDVKKLIRA